MGSIKDLVSGRFTTVTRPPEPTLTEAIVGAGAKDTLSAEQLAGYQARANAVSKKVASENALYERKREAMKAAKKAQEDALWQRYLAK